MDPKFKNRDLKICESIEDDTNYSNDILCPYCGKELIKTGDLGAMTITCKTDGCFKSTCRGI